MKYLARYVVGSAISDHRILSDDGETVTIRAKDYRTGEFKTLPLSGEEFVGRYVQHILPRSLRRLRYGGLFSPRNRDKRLALCRQLLQDHPAVVTRQQVDGSLSPGEVDGKADDEPKRPGPVCPRCLMPGMIFEARLSGGRRAST